MKNFDQQFYYKNNRLQQLRGFCYAAQFGSVTRAAEHMGLTQSNVSRQIKTLEQDLGVILFQRKGPNIYLTAEGEKLLDMTLPLIDSIQDLPKEFHKELKTIKRTEFHIAVNSTTLNFILPPIIKKFVDSDPDIHIVLHFAEHDAAMKLVETDAVEFAVLPRRDHMPWPKNCDYFPVFYYRSCLITPPGHPLAGRKKLTVKEISRYELTLPAENLRVIPNLYDVFPQHNINKKLRVSFVNWETTRKYIEIGLAISIASDALIREDNPSTLVATPLSHLFPDVDYGFIKKRSRPMSDRIKKFIALAREHAALKNAVPARARKRKAA